MESKTQHTRNPKRNFNKTLKQETQFQITKLNFHQGLIKYLMSSTILQLILTVSVNPFGMSLSSTKFITINVFLIILVLIGAYLLWKNSVYVEKYIVIFILAILINILELKEDLFSFWSKNTFFTYGSVFQFMYLAMPLAKISWKSITFASSILIIFLMSRYFDYEENSKFKYFPMITYIANVIFVSFSSLVLEKYERRLFLQNKKFNKTQKRLKNLIIDVIPSAALIVKKGKIIFANQNVEKLFQKVTFEDILAETKKITISTNIEKKKNCSFSENISPMRDALAKEHYLKIEKNELEEEEVTLFNIINLKSHPELKKYIGAFKRIDYTTYLDISVSKIFWDGEEGLFLFIHENEVAQKLNDLERQAKYKDKLLATVSHDLRTPLNGILGMIKLAILRITDEVAKESLLIADRSANLLLNMINDLLDMSQISNGSLRLNIKKFSIVELIEEVSQLISFQARYKGLDFIIINNIDRMKPFIYNDPNRLKQIILNLLGNALKFTDKGFIKIFLEDSSIPSENKSENIECFEKNELNFKSNFLIRVEDSGNGIKKEDIPKLFRLFGKLETEENNRVNQTGVGLGLSISQNLVKLLNKNKQGYEISVTSEIGRGSCFSFSIQSLKEEYKETEKKYNEFKSQGLEAIQSIPEFEINSRRKFGLSKGKTAKSRILIVEDDPINMMVVTSYLKFYEDLIFDITHNGCEALEMVTKMASFGIDYDLILMDCNMPVMDGFQASKMILAFIYEERRQPLDIIAMTANVSPVDYENCFKAGMKDYISKPFTREKLREIVIKYTIKG